MSFISAFRLEALTITKANLEIYCSLGTKATVSVCPYVFIDFVALCCLSGPSPAQRRPTSEIEAFKGFVAHFSFSPFCSSADFAQGNNPQCLALWC